MAWNALWLTALLAGVTTALLLVAALPLAWWLSRTQHWLKPIIEAITAMPLVLPPTVIGFYLLLLFSPNNPLGGAWLAITGETLSFSFEGLVLASMIYSLPFAVQPLQSAFEALDDAVLEAAGSLGAGRWDRLFSIALPLSKRGVLTAAILSFAHTVGEFGVVLMVGGSIPGETKVISIAIYEHVETLRYGEAHILSAIMVVFSFAVLFSVYALNRKALLRAG
ncbi:MAG: molybdate ABC transporter permease subunit [Pseudomonadota bacterium]